eukprot:CAMPEP_0119296566 /NCGR_PEP_ID=MMETSP1329-20130426/50637_1 /TAXON_ID=114041 /ORGANISM="Genus nov. species nov., Strain RCC1024" /LENGTH=291 /DNA_ID=CAMNT_0007297501 /DNA_START=254 /DNA_END=1126 /DNA_ORIENTATION=+
MHFTVAADRAGRYVVTALLLHSIAQRWEVLEAAYSDAGALPVATWRAHVGGDWLHRLVCAHAWRGGLWWAQGLSCLQAFFALQLTGDRPRLAALASLWLYASATARHARLAFILDRYAHAASTRVEGQPSWVSRRLDARRASSLDTAERRETGLAQLGGRRQPSPRAASSTLGPHEKRRSCLQAFFALQLTGDRPRLAALASLWLYASATARHARLAFILDRYAHVLLLWCALAPEAPGSLAGLACAALFRLQLVWIYLDAGLAKLRDPERGWSAAAGRPALDAYLRHTAP